MTGAYGGPNVLDALGVLEEEDRLCTCGRSWPDHEDDCPASKMLDEEDDDG